MKSIFLCINSEDANVDAIVQSAKDAGMTVGLVLHVSGVITGTASDEAIVAIRKIPGVNAVEDVEK